ncbi:MAG: hypothetical protein LBJ67_03635 [Planctomycetaceae bacterium]|nr:hypothetical protein [Planctomycetaceae bacterium]
MLKVSVSLENDEEPTSQKTNYEQARAIGENAAFERFSILGDVLYVAAKEDETVEPIAACRNWHVGIAMKHLGEYFNEEEILVEV